MIFDSLALQIEFLALLADDDETMYQNVRLHGWKKVLVGWSDDFWSLDQLDDAPDSVVALLTALPASKGRIPKRSDVAQYDNVGDFLTDVSGLINTMPRTTYPEHCYTTWPHVLKMERRWKVSAWYAGKDMIPGHDEQIIEALEEYP